MNTPHFSLGNVVSTRTVYDWADSDPVRHKELYTCLARHADGDWGDVHPGDQGLNDAALQDGDRLLSVYPLSDPDNPVLWIITEADRSVTTLLFPEDY